MYGRKKNDYLIFTINNSAACRHAHIYALFALRTAELQVSIMYKVKSGKKQKKRTCGINSFTVAFDNIKRMPKKSAAVVLSISLSIILLNAAVTVSRGFDMDKYIKNMVVSDFYITDKSIKQTAC